MEDKLKLWRDRAEEARAHAESMINPSARRIMLEIAEGYEKLIRELEAERARNGRP
ncbi:MAG TPA: hypothetical protein VN668_10855 [Stellaceae bacterium]|nr:hypothetical protein [Stellaceae bacterium]